MSGHGVIQNFGAEHGRMGNHLHGSMGSRFSNGSVRLLTSDLTVNFTAFDVNEFGGHITC